MKKVVVAIIMVLAVMLIGGSKVYAGVNDFYFEDFTGDYYLKRAEDEFDIAEFDAE